MGRRSMAMRWFSTFILLYTQVVIAYASCLSLSARSADAFGDMPVECPRQFEANICLAHCQQSDQSSAHASTPILPALDGITLRLPMLAPVLSKRAGDAFEASRTTHPPPQILLCSLNL